jgi:hypothetical protein
MLRRPAPEGAAMRHVVLAALSLTFAIPALAEPVAVVPPATDPLADTDVGFEGCGSHAAVSRWLAHNFTETPLARGLQGDGRLYELYMAKVGETWTVVVTDPGGESCIITEGTSMEVLQQVAGPLA